MSQSSDGIWHNSMLGVPEPGSRTFEGVGTVRAIEEAVISPRVPGTIRALEVVAGDRVKRGQVLLRLAAPELAAQQEAMLGKSRSNPRRLEKRLG